MDYSPPPSLYLFVRQLPRTSLTALLTKFSDAISSSPFLCRSSSLSTKAASSASKVPSVSSAKVGRSIETMNVEEVSCGVEGFRIGKETVGNAFERCSDAHASGRRASLENFIPRCFASLARVSSRRELVQCCCRLIKDLGEWLIYAPSKRNETFNAQMLFFDSSPIEWICVSTFSSQKACRRTDEQKLWSVVPSTIIKQSFQVSKRLEP